MKELMKWNFATKLETYKSMAIIAGRLITSLLPKKQQRPEGPDQRKWWQKPVFACSTRSRSVPM